MKQIPYRIYLAGIINRVIPFFSLALSGFLFPSCENFLEIAPPKSQLVRETVYQSDETATASVLGIYSRMAGATNVVSGNRSISFLSGLLSDELQNYSTNVDQTAFYLNSLTSTNDYIGSSWNELYRFIYYTNAILEGLTHSSGVSEATKMRLEGEAKFLRAFYYFYLVNLFGDIPLILTTDYSKNSSAPNTPQLKVYEQIISDLGDAKALLDDNYMEDDLEKSRPNKAAAKAMLARVYLYLNDWKNAEILASAVIEDPNYSLLQDLDVVFLANSYEAIWQLQPVSAGRNTFEAYYFVLTRAPSSGTLRSTTLSDALLNSFEIGDNRRTSWIGEVTNSAKTYYFPNKYKIYQLDQPVTEYLMILRLAELYLIRAEARAQQDDVIGAQTDLNSIRSRAGLSNTAESTKSGLLLAIEQERKVEFFTEWGHRWFDLKRTDRATSVLLPIKGPNWQDTDLLLPIPENELDLAPNLQQNDGYL